MATLRVYLININKKLSTFFSVLSNIIKISLKRERERERRAKYHRIIKASFYYRIFIYWNGMQHENNATESHHHQLTFVCDKKHAYYINI